MVFLGLPWYVWQHQGKIQFTLTVIGQLICNGTVFDAQTAAGAKIHIDASRPLPDFDLEVPGGTLNGFKIRVGDKFNV